ncbi:anthrone oxygenase family protein [Lapillicoccus sp.]|uniref:anthrone oxygenase family protein n=1 Tax=Lapillicoccus sp. TaxID=1909287 RepID=UPI0025E87E06|nr:anthrone oxygenase family protein [Lapillicoccus sp.]
MTSTTAVLVSAAALGTTAVGGAFLAFSSFVMPALGRLPAREAVVAMQAVNVTAVSTIFMMTLFGSGALCLVTGWRAVVGWGTPAASWLLAGSAAYLIGVIGVTVAASVPRNDRLAALDPASAPAAAIWADYLSRWTAWNHVRTVAGLLSGAAFLVASGARAL